VHQVHPQCAWPVAGAGTERRACCVRPCCCARARQAWLEDKLAPQPVPALCAEQHRCRGLQEPAGGRDCGVLCGDRRGRQDEGGEGYRPRRRTPAGAVPAVRGHTPRSPGRKRAARRCSADALAVPGAQLADVYNKLRRVRFGAAAPALAAPRASKAAADALSAGLPAASVGSHCCAREMPALTPPMCAGCVLTCVMQPRRARRGGRTRARTRWGRWRDQWGRRR